MVVIGESAMHLRIFTRFRAYEFLIIIAEDIYTWGRRRWRSPGNCKLQTENVGWPNTFDHKFSSMHTNNYLALNKQWNWKFKTLIVVSLRHMQI